ncbi:integrase arm-type DNA-binding domain-containing protein [Acinetobacter sp.]|uniref:integrase arm-type DNA-binding domain-containing protein n=1 Tax=Acinetobacter sp. TaxID=472 RepID=UPI0025BD44D6|nr:integrase arm-type DNA-binding domain-containing protein [Acinetobacter sp.]
MSSHKKNDEKTLLKLADSNDLYLIIDKNSSTYWRFDYTRPITRKRNSMSFGIYPDVSLADVREKRAECKKLITQNIDPSTEKKCDVEVSCNFSTHQFAPIKTHSIEWVLFSRIKKSYF